MAVFLFTLKIFGVSFVCASINECVGDHAIIVRVRSVPRNRCQEIHAEQSMADRAPLLMSSDRACLRVLCRNRNEAVWR